MINRKYKYGGRNMSKHIDNYNKYRLNPPVTILLYFSFLKRG